MRSTLAADGDAGNGDPVTVDNFMASFGFVNFGHPQFGECLYCWDENSHRDGGVTFGGRVIMRGPVCGHKLHPFRKTIPQFKINRIRSERRSSKNAKAS